MWLTIDILKGFKGSNNVSGGIIIHATHVKYFPQDEGFTNEGTKILLEVSI